MLRLATALALAVMATAAVPAAADGIGGGQMAVGAVSSAAMSLGVWPDGHVDPAGNTVAFDVRRTHEAGRLVITIVPRD